MKLTTARLKKLIKEELETTLREMEGGEKKNQEYDKLLTLMSDKDSVNSAEILYQSIKNELTPEQQAFLDSCFKALELAREASQAHDNRQYDSEENIFQKFNKKFDEALGEMIRNAPQKDDLHKNAFLGVRAAAVDEADGVFGMLDL